MADVLLADGRELGNSPRHITFAIGIVNMLIQHACFGRGIIDFAAFSHLRLDCIIDRGYQLVCRFDIELRFDRGFR